MSDDEMMAVVEKFIKDGKGSVKTLMDRQKRTLSAAFESVAREAAVRILLSFGSGFLNRSILNRRCRFVCRL